MKVKERCQMFDTDTLIHPDYKNIGKKVKLPNRNKTKPKDKNRSKVKRSSKSCKEMHNWMPRSIN